MAEIEEALHAVLSAHAGAEPQINAVYTDRGDAIDEREALREEADVEEKFVVLPIRPDDVQTSRTEPNPCGCKAPSEQIADDIAECQECGGQWDIEATDEGSA